MAAVVLTLIGRDRPGLVERLSTLINEHGGNWEQSQVVRLADRFAGVVLVTVADAKAGGLVRALDAFDSEGLLHVTAEQADAAAVDAPGEVIALEVTGHDRPGIVQQISHLLAGAGVSIDRLESETSSASYSGENLFTARAALRVPESVDTHALKTSLESISNELMVDITLGANEKM